MSPRVSVAIASRVMTPDKAATPICAASGSRGVAGDVLHLDALRSRHHGSSAVGVNGARVFEGPELPNRAALPVWPTGP